MAGDHREEVPRVVLAPNRSIVVGGALLLGASLLGGCSPSDGGAEAVRSPEAEDASAGDWSDQHNTVEAPEPLSRDPVEREIFLATESSGSLSIEAAICRADLETTVVEDDESVEITLVSRGGQPGDDCGSGIRVELDQPLGDRVLIDAVTGRHVEVSRSE